MISAEEPREEEKLLGCVAILATDAEEQQERLRNKEPRLESKESLLSLFKYIHI